MTTYILLAIIGVGAVLWGYGLWRRGFFGPETLPVERHAYALRNALWFVSIVIVSWPLRSYRASIGSTAYVVAALAVLVAFFWLGLLVQKYLFKRAQAWDSGA